MVLQVSHLRLSHPTAVWQLLQPTLSHRDARAQGCFLIKSLTFVNTLFHALQVSHLRLGHPKAVWQPLQPTSRHRGARAQNRARLHKGLQRRPIWDDEAALDVPELCGGARDDEVKEHWGRPRDVALTIL